MSCRRIQDPVPFKIRKYTVSDLRDLTQMRLRDTDEIALRLLVNSTIPLEEIIRCSIDTSIKVKTILVDGRAVGLFGCYVKDRVGSIWLLLDRNYALSSIRVYRVITQYISELKQYCFVIYNYLWEKNIGMRKMLKLLDFGSYGDHEFRLYYRFIQT